MRWLIFIALLTSSCSYLPIEKEDRYGGHYVQSYDVGFSQGCRTMFYNFVNNPIQKNKQQAEKWVEGVLDEYGTNLKNICKDNSEKPRYLEGIKMCIDAGYDTSCIK